jgi:hypothetical protein
VGFEAKDSPLIKSESFPNGIAILDRGIKGADPGFIAMKVGAVNENELGCCSLVMTLIRRQENRSLSDLHFGIGNLQICVNLRHEIHQFPPDFSHPLCASSG